MKIEIIRNGADWIVLDGSGAVIFSLTERVYTDDIPYELEKFLGKTLGGMK